MEKGEPSRTKLYVVVDQKLSNGAKACQAAHALRDFAQHYPFIESRWFKESNTLVMLETEDISGLFEQAKKENNLTVVPFYEPDWDIDGTLTALAFGPEAKKLLRNLPLLS